MAQKRRNDLGLTLKILRACYTSGAEKWNSAISSCVKEIAKELLLDVKLNEAMPEEAPEVVEDACEPAPVQRRQPLSGIDELKW